MPFAKHSSDVQAMYEKQLKIAKHIHKRQPLKLSVFMANVHSALTRRQLMWFAVQKKAIETTEHKLKKIAELKMEVKELKERLEDFGETNSLLLDEIEKLRRDKPRVGH
jgi:hypothetical protein